MVKFHRPELGTQKVLDILMAAKEHYSPHRVIVENVDFEVMALAIRLLELKTDFLKLMKHYNAKAREIQAKQGSLDNLFFQEYGWIGSTINILSLGIKHVVVKFRVRGLTAASTRPMSKTKTKSANTSPPSSSTPWPSWRRNSRRAANTPTSSPPNRSRTSSTLTERSTPRYLDKD